MEFLQVDEPEIVDLVAFRVVGEQARIVGGTPDPGSLWSRLAEFRARGGPWPQADLAFGVAYDFVPEHGEFSYLAGYRVDADAAVPGGLEAVDVPASTDAAFRTTLPRLMDTIGHARRVWLPASAFLAGSGPELERYGAGFDAADPASTLTYLIPVVAPAAPDSASDGRDLR